jgi:hypothetical protein
MIAAFFLKWRLVLIATASAFALGSATGAFVTWRVVDTLRDARALSDARTELRRYQKMVGIAAEIDDDTIKWEISNDDIVQAIIRKSAQLSPPAEPSQCVSADSMQQLGELKLFTPGPAGKRQERRKDHRLALRGEAETTALIARLRQSEVRNAQAVNDCKRFYHQLRRTLSGE